MHWLNFISATKCNHFISQVWVKLFLTFCFTGFGTALTTILPILFQYCYKYCYSDSRNLWSVMKAGGLKSDSNHHFFRNACTKSGSLRFSQFSGCWLILSVYEFWLSLCKIVQSSVILSLPLLGSNYVILANHLVSLITSSTTDPGMYKYIDNINFFF